MKKLLLMACIMATMSFGARAQNTFAQTTSNPTGTITGTSVDTMTVQLNGYNAVVGVQYLVTRSAGTIASATVALQGSIDGANYVTIQTDTLTNAAIATGIFTLTAPVYIKYRILVTGVSTMVATASAKIVGRKP